jgi:hypothetical protein
MSFSSALETAGKRLHTIYVPPTLLKYCFLECIQQIENEIHGRIDRIGGAVWGIGFEAAPNAKIRAKQLGRAISS